MKAPLTRFLSDFLFFSLLLVLSSAVLFAAALRTVGQPAARTAADSPAPSRPIIVLDAGHGGEDGGASGKDGTAEKDLNLAVAQTVGEILSAAGYDVRLTRTEDHLLYDMYGDLTDYTGRRKTYDLRNRLRFADEAGAGLLVSIHMNKFPEEKYSGLQVYYADVQGSQPVAEVIKNYTKLYLQPDNTRETKRATSSIYLLSRAKMPAVMIECGFLSNPEELSRLKDPLYQKQLSLVIACGVAQSAAQIRT